MDDDPDNLGDLGDHDDHDDPDDSDVKTLKLAVWAFSKNVLHDFTLFVIDSFASLFQHHFYFRPTLAKKCIPNLTLYLTHFFTDCHI